jgi:hypothetical protein
LARALNLCGCDIGTRANWAGEDNPKGFWEDRGFLDVNEYLLAANGGKWDDPPQTLEVGALDKQTTMALMAGYSQAPIVVKDPRFSLLWPIYETTFKDAFLVAPIRHPVAVAMSLMSRNGLTEEFWLKLWRHYNLALLNFGARFVEYPTQKGLSRLLSDLNLEDHTGDWFDKEAVHALPGACGEVYENLYRQIVENIKE